MASLALVATANEGHASLGGDHTVVHMTARLITDNPKQTRYVGLMYPRGVWHIGQAGIGAFPDDSTATDPAIVRLAWFLHFENEDWWVPAFPSLGFSASSVWWRWLPGVTVDLEVFW